MQITQVNIRTTNEHLVKGYVDIFDNCFMIEEIRIRRLFVSFPAKKQGDGTHRQIVYPANAETRNMIQRVILAEYEKVTEKLCAERGRAKDPDPVRI